MVCTASLLWTFVVLLIISRLNYGSASTEKNRAKRNIYQEQPRMSSERGNLVFNTGSAKNIEFRTGSQGRIKVNEEDLTETFSQIRKNKDEILELKRVIPQNVSSQITQLHSKIVNIENRFQSLEQTFLRKACNSNPCQNSGTCINLLDAFFCLCPNNWQGPFCSVDVNECQIYAGTPLGCQNGATCVNTPGSYSCTCTPETYGPHCVSKFDDCQGGSAALCEHGLCIDGNREQPNQPKYSCVCEAGWMSPPGSPACSADIDECSLPKPPCSLNPPVQCYNTLGSYFCGPCPAGWQGNGYSCQDVNECETENGGCSTAPMVQCINTMGSFYCGHCPPGYEGDGKVCTQVDVCSVNNGGCHPLAACTSLPGPLPSCVCPAGYTGNGYGPNGCLALSNICQSHNPCLNGQCLATPSGYNCVCDPGWTGTNCTENMDECSSNPCQHGGSCIDGVNGYFCECTSTWTGSQCETPQRVCGGSLSGLSGSFSYPNNPGAEQYAPQVSCAWVIRTRFNKILRITFPFFQLEESSRCRSDFLQIHDGESASEHMLGKYCGSSHPEELFSSHNSLYFWFRSDRMINAGGFAVHWESREPECGGELNNTYGSINSPGYPGNYPPNRDCYWTLSINPSLLITFAFGTLSLEHHDNCSQDYLEIRDGLLPQDPLLGKYCSTGSPPPLQTTGPYAWVHFHSNAVGSDRGFHITYTTSPADPNCGGNYTDSHGVLMSPYWPNSYLNNRQCIYIIRLPPGEKIYLNFTHLDLEIHPPGCSWNYVEVRDGDTEISPLINKFCGNVVPSAIISNTNSLWVKFKSDTSVHRSSFRALYEVACGGALSGEGVVRSPYYSRALSQGKVCEWIISQTEGNVVILNFTDFQIHNITTCVSDYVQIRDGNNVNSPSLGKYCGVNVPSIVQSTQNYLYLKFRASSVTNFGFMAEYKSLDKACGGTLTEPAGAIANPDYLATYPHGVKCSWTILVQPGYLIRLTFTSFNLEFDYPCYRDYLEIYDNITMTKLGRYCGRSIPPSITSSGNTLTLYFVTNHNIVSEGFLVDYASLNASTVCSHDYTEASGVLTSPNYPNHYPNKMTCIYKISVGNNKQISLHFTNFSLEGGVCTGDYVELRDGGYETSPLLGRYCGTSLPPVTISHSNKLWMKFVSDVYFASTGFSAYWDGTSTGCGGTLSTSSGIFMSPNYPLPYFHNAECYWLLKASRGSPFEIQFDQFHLESHSRCAFDYLAVYDGNSTNAKVLGKFCGNQIPPSIRSTGDTLYVKLRTDGSLGGGGFLARYVQIYQGVVIANRSQGILESLNYPHNYPPNVYGDWTIQTTAGNTLNYSFTAFSTKGGENCARDNLKLYDGPNAQSSLIGTFCGDTDLPSGGATTSSSLHVVFFSDQIDESTGFQMLWHAHGCGGELSGTSGSFHSLGYPDKYPPNRECHWFIHTAPGSSIQLTIVEFDVEYHPSCNYDVLEIYGGLDFSSPRLTQLCIPRSLQNPLRVSSTGNAIAVRFKTNNSVNGKGFNATWQAIAGGCGGVFHAPNGEIHSPNYPQPYSNNTDCSWIIQVDSGHRVLLNFTDFEIESHQACNYDYVAVFDGSNNEAPLLGKVCGGQQPSPITSSQNTMFVWFRSDNTVHHKGFSARFTEACGSVLEADSVGAAISSPLFPAKYPNNQNCSWIIRAQEPFNHVTLSFTDFVTEDIRRNCTTDYVEIREGDNDGAPLQGRYCGTTMPHPVTSFGSALFINFVSNNAITAKGFHATFAASTSACGGTFHMERGAFNSPEFPEPYPPNIECVWNILSSPGNRLQLSFTEFQVEESTDCAKDYLEIWEGSLSGHLVGRYCGNALTNHTSVTGHILWIKFISDGSQTGMGFRATFAHLFGNNIAGNSGQIASPLWPRYYPHHSNYQWTITVNTTQIIHGQISQMDIEDLYNCYYDKLKIYDGPNTHSRLIAKYCGVAPSSFTSSGSSVTLQFISDSSINGRGFLLDWYAVEALTDVGHTIPIGACGGVATASEVPLFLFSPGWPSNYRHFAECTWVIRARDSTVEFNILALDIESHSSCSYDKLVFRDGDNSLAPVMSTVCGREVPGPIRSTRDAMLIQFTSDASIAGAGFNATFHKSCGGSSEADRGVIFSPNYPQMYPPNQNCSWHVLVTAGFIIGVHFEQLFQVLNEDASCSHGDYVELRNGPDLSAPPLGPSGGNGHFCGSSSISTMYTTDNQLFVRFSSDSSNEGQGFKLKFEAKGLACGGNIYISESSPSGFVSSPNYPGNYPPHADCVWTIIAPYGKAVELQFEDQFDIEPSPSCTLSYLELRDGADSNAPVIARLCGNALPGIQRSSGATLYMRFRSDGTNTQAGFNAKYSRAECGGTLTGQNGFVESVGFPGHHYPDNLLCEWFLRGPMGHYLTIRFEALDIQNSSECINDYLEIREYNASGDVLGKYCGRDIPNALDTSGNMVYIKFVTDGSINAPGFRLHFAASAEECGGELRGTTGTFTSPNYPNSYPHKLRCEWRIMVPLGHRVTLTISDMNFGSNQNCNSDYVAIHNGFGEHTPRLSKLCGMVIAGTQVKSSGNKISVILVTSHNDAEGSFRITYSSEEDAVCGGLLLSSDGGNLTSPGYDAISNYTNNLNCEWVIRNPHPSITTVSLLFQDFRLEQHINCQNDYLEIRLGDSDGQLLYRLCGRGAPEEPLLVAAPEIWIQFVSNEEHADKGFFIHYLSQPCGGVQEAEGGIILSPNYPQPYNSSSHCSWLLVAPEGHTINLTFVNFAVEMHRGCLWDSVTILNGGSPTSPVIGRYCGRTSPGTIQSGSNQLLVNFVSDHSVQGDGFYATWTADSLGCGGILHSENGTISSPHWPQNFPSNIRCAWRIISHESSHLEITFDENFQIPDSNGQCQGSFVKVLKGSDEEQEDAILAIGCGNAAPRPIVAPRNVMTTVFQSQDIPGCGFSASFISRCGANFSASSGRIVSPNFPSQYDNNSNCNYIIEVKPQAVVIIRFETFDLQPHNALQICAYDGVKIFKGNRVNPYPVEAFCGNEIPAPVGIFGTVLLNFYTDSHTVGTGFLATYKVISCGGVFNRSSGTIMSPTHSVTDYHHNMNCSYHIIVGSNKIVALKFNSFQLEASSSCDKDYVAVYDGPSTVALLLGKFCGEALPPIIKSSTNNLFLVFKTDSFEAAGGWKASFRETIGPQQGCGGYLTKSSSSFGSPDSNNDGKYDKDLECVWIIAAPMNKLVNLTFSTFTLEAASSPQGCRFDYVKLYDGSSENAPLVGSFCGSSIPAPFVSTDKFLTVKFVTDMTVERAGFNATYTTVDRLCGGVYNATSASQTATSPYFPNAYPPFTVCKWVIDAPPEQQVKLVVRTFHLQSSQDCSQNYLEFQDSPLGNQEHADRVHRFCSFENFAIPEFYSYRRTALVIFRSDAYMINNGLSFSYQASGCNREYNQSFGNLKSPGWPDPYPRNLDCTIILRAPLNHTISLFFSSFNLEDDGCRHDFLEVRNGSDASSPLLGKYCGHTLPSPVFPKNHVVYLRFKSDVLISYEGYEITWTSSPAGCGGTLYGETGSLASPEYPASYQNQTDCEWIIKAPKGRVVTVNFAFISIDDPGDCISNYLILYKGPDTTYASMGPYCGMDTNIAPITTASNQVFIKFHSEYVTLPSGFLLTWNS